MSVADVRLSEEELTDLAAAVAGYCAERLPAPTTARPGTRRDPERVRSEWYSAAGELGIGSLLIGEAHGGAGASLVEAGRVAEALGASLAALPYLSTAVFAPVLLAGLAAGGAAGAAEQLAAVAAGDSIVAVG
ncbi:acyl-CoA dehydrogenase family protein, partial [Tsukamurella soli]|uniref:acyl-CoA dehydrogenase family protein n=1 Tax=Tsukamurella soli TaxID=644556 RepID=UPI0031EFB874